MRKDGDPEALGRIMLENQKLLAPVSTSEIEAAIREIDGLGGYGSKISGGGGKGSTLIALMPETRTSSLLNVWKQRGLVCREVKECISGVKVESDTGPT